MSERDASGLNGDSQSELALDAACQEGIGITETKTPSTTIQATSKSSVAVVTWPPIGVKPYYLDEHCCIIHGDCREILPALTADVLITDPPYGIGKAEWDVSFPQWMFEPCFAAARTVCIMPGLWALPQCILGMGSRYRWVMCGHNLNGMTFGAVGYSNWIPAVVGGDVRRNGQDATSFTCGADPDTDHPSMKPMPFVRWLVARLTEQEQSVLDPFMGSGTTLRAAKDLGRRAIGIEIEERYCEIAVKRLAQRVLSL